MEGSTQSSNGMGTPKKRVKNAYGVYCISFLKCEVTISQVMFFFAVGVDLIWSAEENIYTRSSRHLLI